MWETDLERKDTADILKLERKFELESHLGVVSAFSLVEAFFLSAFCDLEYVSEASAWETSRNLDEISFYLHILIGYENLGSNSPLLRVFLGLLCVHHRVTGEVGSNLVCRIFRGSVYFVDTHTLCQCSSSLVYPCLKVFAGKQ